MLFCNVYVNSMELITFSPCFPCKNGIFLVREMPFSKIKRKFFSYSLRFQGTSFLSRNWRNRLKMRPSTERTMTPAMRRSVIMRSP